jgi:hypothetical protein
LLDAKNLTLDLNRKAPYVIGNSFKINLENDIGTDWRTNRRKNKRAVLTDVPTAAHSLSGLPISVGPTKCDCCLQNEPEGFSGWPTKIQQAPPSISLKRTQTKYANWPAEKGRKVIRVLLTLSCDTN